MWESTRRPGVDGSGGRSPWLGKVKAQWDAGGIGLSTESFLLESGGIHVINLFNLNVLPFSKEMWRDFRKTPWLWVQVDGSGAGVLGVGNVARAEPALSVSRW